MPAEPTTVHTQSTTSPSTDGARRGFFVPQLAVGDLSYISPSKFRSDYETIDGPLLIVFNYPTVGGTHMNVIFDRQGSTVMAMEPYFPFPGRDGQRTGKYERRDLSFYANSSEIGIGCLPLADAFYQQQ